MMIHLSVGAIIFYSKNVQHIVLLYRKKTDTYHLPKGTVEEQEHIMQTLHREIREETNLDIDIQKFVTDAKSSFFRDEKEIKKRTLYFCAIQKKGEITCLDNEHDSIDWYSIERALELLKKKGAHHTLGYEDEYGVLQEYCLQYKIAIA